MALVLLTISSLIVTIFATESSTPSTLHLSESYPGFDGVNQNTFRCSSEVKDGSFTFDSGRGVSYFALSNDMFYLEYYAPMFYWTGFAASGIIITIHNSLFI